MENLRLLPAKFLGPGDGEDVYLLASGDNYDASRAENSLNAIAECLRTILLPGSMPVSRLWGVRTSWVPSCRPAGCNLICSSPSQNPIAGSVSALSLGSKQRSSGGSCLSGGVRWLNTVTLKRV
jgi:hypothetical protein